MPTPSHFMVFCVLFNTESVLVSTAGKMPSLLNAEGGKRLTIENINKNIARIEFAVQGPVHRRALELRQELAQGATKPFKDVVDASVGEATSCGQNPITFIRQVTALTCLPELLNDSAFPEDVKGRAKDFLENCQGNSIGSLTDTIGLEMVRRHIAEFIHQRDNCPADWRNVIIVPGVSAAVKVLFKLMNYSSEGLPTGVMVPVPQFPVFTAALTEYDIAKVDYYLNEEDGWSLDSDELSRSLSAGRSHCHPRAIVVINPGNPTGQVLTRENIEEVVKFAEEEKLLIIAVEVYQDNVYDDQAFHSFKKVLCEMGPPFSNTELVSLMSCSRGYVEESGLRGGFMELCNVSPLIRDSLIKSIMISDSPPVCAQIILDCITNPPRLGEPSYPLFHQERSKILTVLGDRAKMMFDIINSIQGLSCRPIQGAFFAFVKVEIPDKAVEKAKSLNQCPSTFYVLEMLEQAGVVTVPGEGFGQKPGTYHFRITILLPEARLKETLRRIQDFHIKFMDKYTSGTEEGVQR